LRKKIATSGDFLTSSHSVPVWITSLAFLAANLGAQELVGMCGNGAKYGIITAHFYWVGAVPAMIFVGLFMMPFYYGSRARSVPEYLKLRFDEKTRALNALSFAGMTIFSSGIQHVRTRPVAEAGVGLGFHNQRAGFRSHRAGLHVPRRTDQRDL
jgi:SSS family solute:Na+ symporter